MFPSSLYSYIFVIKLLTSFDGGDIHQPRQTNKLKHKRKGGAGLEISKELMLKATG